MSSKWTDYSWDLGLTDEEKHLDVFFQPALTWSSEAKNEAKGIILFFIENNPSRTDGEDFKQLVRGLLSWIWVVSEKGIDDTISKEDALPYFQSLYDQFLSDNFTYEELIGFLEVYYIFRIQEPLSSDGEKEGIIFPMLPQLDLKVGSDVPINSSEMARGSKQESQDIFSGQYLPVQEKEENPPAVESKSARKFIFEDYGRLLMRSALQMIKDHLEQSLDQNPELGEVELTIKELINEITYDNFINLAGMVSRFMLHGVRLDTNDGEEALYDAIGQQFNLSEAKTDTDYRFIISTDSALDFLKFYPFDELNPIHSLSYSFPLSEDITEPKYPLLALTHSFNKLENSPLSLVPENIKLLPFYREEPRLFALRKWVKWEAAPTDKTDSTYQFQIPQSLQFFLQKKDPNPIISLYQIDPSKRPENLTDKKNEGVELFTNSEYNWSTRINISISRIPKSEGEGYLEDTYALSGISEAEINLLESILKKEDLNSSSTLQLLFASEGGTTAPTLSTYPNFGVDNKGQFLLLRNNFSTNNPDSNITSPAVQAKMDNETAFLQLLWEGATVDNGGYYFYFPSENQEPETLFDSGDIGQIILIIEFQSDVEDPILDFHNNVILEVAATVDIESHLIIAKIEDQLDANEKVIVNEKVSILNIPPGFFGFNYETDILPETESELLALIPDSKVLANTELLEEPNTTKKISDVSIGSNVKAINLSEGNQWVLVQLNDGKKGWIPLIQPIQNPPKDNSYKLKDATKVYILSVPAAEEKSTTLPQNTLVDILEIKEERIKIESGTSTGWVDKTTYFIETVFELPTGFNIDTQHAKRELQNLYQLLGFQIKGNSNNKLPIGPTIDETDLSKADKWQYERLIPAYTHFAPSDTSSEQEPDSARNPYNGIETGLDSELTLQYWWQDIYGNKLSNTPVEKPFKIKYTDPLIGINQWPSVSESFQFVRIPDEEPNKVHLEIELSFSPTGYENLKPEGATARRLKADLETYTRIYYQLNQPDIDLIVKTSLDDNWSVDFKPNEVSDQTNVVEFVNAIYNYLLGLYNYLQSLEAIVEDLKAEEIEIEEVIERFINDDDVNGLEQDEVDKLNALKDEIEEELEITIEAELETEIIPQVVSDLDNELIELKKLLIESYYESFKTKHTEQKNKVIEKLNNVNKTEPEIDPILKLIDDLKPDIEENFSSTVYDKGGQLAPILDVLIIDVIEELENPSGTESEIDRIIPIIQNLKSAVTELNETGVSEILDQMLTSAEEELTNLGLTETETNDILTDLNTLKTEVENIRLNATNDYVAILNTKVDVLENEITTELEKVITAETVEEKNDRVKEKLEIEIINLGKAVIPNYGYGERFQEILDIKKGEQLQEKINTSLTERTNEVLVFQGFNTIKKLREDSFYVDYAKEMSKQNLSQSKIIYSEDAYTKSIDASYLVPKSKFIQGLDSSITISRNIENIHSSLLIDSTNPQKGVDQKYQQVYQSLAILSPKHESSTYPTPDSPTLLGKSLQQTTEDILSNLQLSVTEENLVDWNQDVPNVIKYKEEVEIKEVEVLVDGVLETEEIVVVNVLETVAFPLLLGRIESKVGDTFKSISDELAQQIESSTERPKESFSEIDFVENFKVKTGIFKANAKLNLGDLNDQKHLFIISPELTLQGIKDEIPSDLIPSLTVKDIAVWNQEVSGIIKTGEEFSLVGLIDLEEDQASIIEQAPPVISKFDDTIKSLTDRIRKTLITELRSSGVNESEINFSVEDFAEKFQDQPNIFIDNSLLNIEGLDDTNHLILLSLEPTLQGIINVLTNNAEALISMEDLVRWNWEVSGIVKEEVDFYVSLIELVDSQISAIDDSMSVVSSLGDTFKSMTLKIKEAFIEALPEKDETNNIPEPIVNFSLRDFTRYFKYKTDIFNSDATLTLESLNLRKFAENFTLAFPNYHLAVSEERNASQDNTTTNDRSQPGPEKFLFAVHMGASGVNYDIKEQDPNFYAIPPLATTLFTGVVTVYDYNDMTGPPTIEKEVNALDMNVLARNFLSAFEDFLKPETIIPALELEEEKVKNILINKFRLAERISQTVIPILEDDDDETIAERLREAQKTIRHKLRLNLIEGFDIESIVQFQADVNDENDLTENVPRLTGRTKVIGASLGEDPNNLIEVEPSSLDYLITPGYFELSGVSTPSSFTYLFDTKTPEKFGNIHLELEFEPLEIEYNLNEILGEFLASDKLRFILPENLNVYQVSEAMIAELKKDDSVPAEDEDSFNKVIEKLEELALLKVSHFSLESFESAIKNIESVVIDYFEKNKDDLLSKTKTEENPDVYKVTDELITELEESSDFDDLEETALAQVLAFLEDIKDKDMTYESLLIEVKNIDGIVVDYYFEKFRNKILSYANPNYMGKNAIPIPLRNYPQPPSLIFQRAESDDSSLEIINDLREWEYKIVYEHQDVAQDSIDCIVKLNVLEEAFGKKIVLPFNTVEEATTAAAEAADNANVEALKAETANQAVITAKANENIARTNAETAAASAAEIIDNLTIAKEEAAKANEEALKAKDAAKLASIEANEAIRAAEAASSLDVNSDDAQKSADDAQASAEAAQKSATQAAQAVDNLFDSLINFEDLFPKISADLALVRKEEFVDGDEEKITKALTAIERLSGLIADNWGSVKIYDNNTSYYIADSKDLHYEISEEPLDNDDDDANIEMRQAVVTWNNPSETNREGVKPLNPILDLPGFSRKLPSENGTPSNPPNTITFTYIEGNVVEFTSEGEFENAIKDIEDIYKPDYDIFKNELFEWVKPTNSGDIIRITDAMFMEINNQEIVTEEGEKEKFEKFLTQLEPLLKSEKKTFAFDPHDYGDSSIPDRVFRIENLDILQYQNAAASIWLSRNKNLVFDRDTNPAFIFQTPAVSFANPAFPFITNDEPFDIAALGSEDGVTPQDLDFQVHMENLLELLKPKATSPEINDYRYEARLSCRFAFSLAKGKGLNDDLVSTLPLLIGLRLSPGDSLDESNRSEILAAYPGKLKEEISTWFKLNRPIEESAYLLFSLDIFSKLDPNENSSLPMLRVKRLELKLKNIEDMDDIRTGNI